MSRLSRRTLLAGLGLFGLTAPPGAEALPLRAEPVPPAPPVEEVRRGGGFRSGRRYGRTGRSPMRDFRWRQRSNRY